MVTPGLLLMNASAHFSARGCTVVEPAVVILFAELPLQPASAVATINSPTATASDHLLLLLNGI
jgi:hypothetical protein